MSPMTTTKICEGGKAVLHFYGCVMIANYTYQARKYSVTEMRPYAQYRRAVSVSWVEPRKRNGVSKRFAPLSVSDGYCVIEVNGEFVYDSRADIPMDMDAFRATRARFGFDGADEGPPEPALTDEQRASYQADLDREREREEQREAMWGKPESKMNREEFEASKRKYAQDMIETGDCNYLSYTSDGPSFTSAEQDEIDQLTPDVIKTVRAACGVIERDLRQRFPDVAALLRPHKGPWTQEELDHLWEASDALTGADRDAYNDLLHLRDVRHHASKNSYHDDWYPSIQHWPARYERPTSPQLRRLSTIYDQAEQRWKDHNREHGRKWLARIDSGEAWQQELEHRAR